MRIPTRWYLPARFQRPMLSQVGMIWMTVLSQRVFGGPAVLWTVVYTIQALLLIAEIHILWTAVEIPDDNVRRAFGLPEDPKR